MSKPKPLSVLEFFKQFPDDATCLEHLMVVRYGKQHQCAKCGKNSKFHRVTKRPVFACQYCGHQVSPMAGTPFEKSRTPLQKWFYAIYLFTTSRHGVPAKELQRQLSVTYKCAWRMGHEIRRYMGDIDGTTPLTGDVEIDETYIGGKDKQRGRPTHKNSKKTGVLGMVERGGRITTVIIPDVKRETLIPLIVDNVERGANISTDELYTYKVLPQYGYNHDSVNHNEKEWVKENTHTQTIEGFWGRLKNSIKGTHVHVSRKHLSKYLVEFEYRYNRRFDSPTCLLDELLAGF